MVIHTPSVDSAAMSAFDLQAILEAYGGPPTAGDAAHLNPRFLDLLRLTGFDRRFVGGRGATLVDDRGDGYVDAIGGYACLSVGRDHSVVREALEQALRLAPPTLIQFEVPPLAVALADRLKRFLDRRDDRVFFVNSGTEAVEAAMKIARAATGRPGFAHWSNAFHGLTFGALSLNGAAWLRRGFEPLVPGCREVPFGDLDALRIALADRSTAAFFYEPIQGKGVIEHGAGVLREVAEICRATDTLLVADEVQTGLGRTGAALASDQDGVVPDLVCLSKALSAGMVPVGAVVGRADVFDRVFDSVERSVVHSSTFRENPLAMTAGLAALQVLEDERLVERSASLGRRLADGLRDLAAREPGVRAVRGRGLMLGVELDPAAMAFDLPGFASRTPTLVAQAVCVRMLVEHRVLVQSTAKSSAVIKIVPPLVIDDTDADRIVEAFGATLTELRRGRGAALRGFLDMIGRAPGVVLRESVR